MNIIDDVKELWEEYRKMHGDDFEAFWKTLAPVVRVAVVRKMQQKNKVSN